MNLVELPEWVKWVATDKTGAINGYAYKPRKSSMFGAWVMDLRDELAPEGLPTFIMLSYEPIGDMSWEDDEPYEVLPLSEDEEGVKLVGNNKKILSWRLSRKSAVANEYDSPSSQQQTTESNMSRFAELMEGMSADRYEVFKDLMNDLIDERLRMLGDDDFDENG